MLKFLVFPCQENYAYAVIGGTCFMRKAHVELYLRLEKSVFRVGEPIRVHAECRVEGGITDVNKVSGRSAREERRNLKIFFKKSPPEDAILGIFLRKKRTT